MNLDRIVRVGRRAVWRTNQREGKYGLLGKTATGPVVFTDQHGVKHHGRNWARVNREGEMTAIVVVNTIAPLIPNLPVKIADRGGVDTVIDFDQQAAFEYTGGRAALPAHAWAHGRLGSDPLYITGPAFLPLMATPTSPASMAVTVQGPAFYSYNGEDKVWQTGDSADLSAYEPSGQVQHFLVLCLDRENNALEVVDGSDSGAVPLSSVPFDADDVADVSVPEGYRRVCAIRLYAGQTTIKPADIFMDLRPWGGEALSASHPVTLDSPTTLTISSGTVTATTDYHLIAAESGTSDDLETITAAEDRQLLWIQADSGDTITVKHGTGNITLNGEADFELSGGTVLALLWDGSSWSDFGAGGGGSGGSGAAYAETIGDGSNTSYAVTHNLGTEDVVVQLWDVSGSDPLEATGDATSIEATDGDTVTITFSAAPSTDQYRVIIVSGGGGGSSTYSDTYASRPPAGNEGDLFLPSDGFVVERDDGSAWVPWGPLFPFVAPVNGDFSWVNQGTASVSTTRGGIHLTIPAGASFTNSLRVKSAPSTPYTITVAFLLLLGPHNSGSASSAGPCWRDSASGKIVTPRIQSDDQILSVDNTKLNGPTSFNSRYEKSRLNPVVFSGGVVWMQLSDDGTDRITRFSCNGQNWVDYHSVGRTDFLTADQVGFLVGTFNNVPAAMTLLHWEES